MSAAPGTQGLIVGDVSTRTAKGAGTVSDGMKYYLDAQKSRPETLRRMMYLRTRLMSLTIDCGEGRHAPVCRGAGTEHYMIPQYDDGTEFVCACKCHIVVPDPAVVEALREVVDEPAPGTTS